MEEEFQREVYVAPQVQELYIPEDQRLSLLDLNEQFGERICVQATFMIERILRCHRGGLTARAS